MKIPQSCEGVNHVHQHQENFDGQLCKHQQEVALSLGGSSGFGWVDVTVGFCPSSTCKGEDQREQGVVTGGGKNQKHTSILSALNGQDARERDAHTVNCSAVSLTQS